MANCSFYRSILSPTTEENGHFNEVDCHFVDECAKSLLSDVESRYEHIGDTSAVPTTRGRRLHHLGSTISAFAKCDRQTERGAVGLRFRGRHIFSSLVFVVVVVVVWR